MTTEPTNLGPLEAFTELPAPITSGKQSYYLTRSGSGYQLLSRVCPHQGGEVGDDGEAFTCPIHGWRFDRRTGRGLNNPEALSAIPVSLRQGCLFAAVADVVPHCAGVQTDKRIEPLTITLHAHACLEIVYKGFSLLTDPWLCGPAFFGAWMHYPAPRVEVSKLRPDAIWISHEHSDHFHEPTLEHFDRSTPVYVPDFPNRRLVERLTALGFQRIYPMAFGERIELSAHMHLTCFEPGSLWNDSILLVELDDFRLLNLNDAGINHRLAALVAPVDMVASFFAPGASGYPWTWMHLSQQQKIDISQRTAEGLLAMLQQAMALYGARYLLPFAGHFTLGHPDHREYVRLMRTNTVDDVVEVFAGSDVQVIPLLPGESWAGSTERIKTVGHCRRQLYDNEYKLRYIERHFDPALFARHHPQATAITREELEACFMRLNDVPEIAFCEDMTVTLEAMADNFSQVVLSFAFAITDGRLDILPSPPATPNLRMRIPRGVLAAIVKDNLSWDEAHIGYWCRFERHPDTYHAGFWRLLQAPYYNKPASLPPADCQPISSHMVIADLLETHGRQAERILRRYGLYCLGCDHSTHDTLALGAQQHGLAQSQVERLVRELNQLFRT